MLLLQIVRLEAQISGLKTCEENQVLLNNLTCASCPSNTKYVNKTCVCDDEYKKYSTYDNKCSCSLALLDNGECASCPLDAVHSGHLCKCSKANYFVTHPTLRCECVGQLEADSSCTPCGKNSVSVNGKCICRLQTVRVGQQCQKCPQNAKYQNGQCNCGSLIWDSGKNECTVQTLGASATVIALSVVCGVLGVSILSVLGIWVWKRFSCKGYESASLKEATAEL